MRIVFGFQPALMKAYREYCEQMCMPPHSGEFQRWIQRYQEVIDTVAAEEA